MTKDRIENTKTDDKQPTGDAAALNRRELLGMAGQAAGACVLAACGGTAPGHDLGHDMRKSDMGSSPVDMGPPDFAPPPCMPKVATGAETLNVGEAKHFYNSSYPAQSFFVARDSKGFFARNDVCPHNQCQAGYNAVAKTYDCPCHGSRFNLDGTVLMGPAPTALKSMKISRRGDGLLEVDPCNGLGDPNARVT